MAKIISLKGTTVGGKLEALGVDLDNVTGRNEWDVIFEILLNQQDRITELEKKLEEK